MKTKILPNIFISIGVLFAAGRLLAGGMPQPTIITFDAPGAGTGGPFQGTLVAGINPAGLIAGGVLDANQVEHTYLRFPDGTFTRFDAPGAGTGPGQGTSAFGNLVQLDVLCRAFDGLAGVSLPRHLAFVIKRFVVVIHGGVLVIYRERDQPRGRVLWQTR